MITDASHGHTPNGPHFRLEQWFLYRSVASYHSAHGEKRAYPAISQMLGVLRCLDFGPRV